jgi:hypothetical protein
MTLTELTPEAIEDVKAKMWILGYEIPLDRGVIHALYADGYIEAMNEVKALLKKATIKTTGDIRIMSDEVDRNWEERWLLLDDETKPE